MLLHIIMVLSIMCITICVWGMFRNNKVYKCRTEINDYWYSTMTVIREYVFSKIDSKDLNLNVGIFLIRKYGEHPLMTEYDSYGDMVFKPWKYDLEKITTSVKNELDLRVEEVLKNN